MNTVYTVPMGASYRMLLRRKCFFWMSLFKIYFTLTSTSVLSIRSCVYWLLQQQPTRSVFLHAGASESPLGSAQSQHGVWGLLSPQRQLGPQDSGQWSFQPFFNNNFMLQYNLYSSRGHDMLFCKRGTNYYSCLVSLAMSSCWLSSTLWEKKVLLVLCLNSYSSHTRYVQQGWL